MPSKMHNVKVTAKTYAQLLNMKHGVELMTDKSTPMAKVIALLIERMTQ